MCTFYPFWLYLSFHTLLRNILTLLLIYLALLHWWQISWCSFCMILLDVLLDIHMHSRSSFPGVIFLPQVFCAFYFSLLYYCLGYLFTSCVYIHFILYYILCVYIIFILVMFVLLLLSKPFLYCLFSHVNLVLHSHTFYFPIFFKFFSEFMF